MKTNVFILAACCALSSNLMANNYPDNLFVLGDATPAGWSTSEAIRMATVEDGKYEYTADFGQGRFKFVTAFDYIPAYGPADAAGDADEKILDAAAGEYDLELRASYDDADKSFYVTEVSRYKLTVDLTGETPKVTIADGTGLADQYATNPFCIYAIGDATPASWETGDAIAMPETAFNSGIYRTTIKLGNGELKFLQKRDWGNQWISTQEGTEITEDGEFDAMFVGGDPDYKWLVKVAGYYQVTLDLNNMKLTVETSYPEQLYLVGPAVSGVENDWNFYDEQVFAQTDEKGVYTWTGDLSVGEVKFFTEKDFLSTAYGATTDNAPLQEGTLPVMELAENDYKFYVADEQTGNYTLTLNLNTLELKATNNRGQGSGMQPAGQKQELSITANRITCTGANRIEVLAANGQRIASAQADCLDISHLHQGMYIAIVHKDGQKSARKFVVR